MMTDEQVRALPKKKANRGETDDYYYMDAYCQKLEQVKRDMEKRCKLVPGAWRDICCIHGLAKKWLYEVGGTFEPGKAAQMKRMGRNMHVELKFNGVRAAQDKDTILVDMDELGVLITAASQECKMRMCEAHECNSCSLGKTFDKLSWVSRGNRAWWEVFAKLVNDGGADDV